MIEIQDDSFRTVSMLWLEKKEAAVKRSTAEGYRKNLRKHLLPAFGDLRVSEISPEKASAFLEMLTTKGSPGCPPVSANTAMANLSQLRSILDYAAREHGFAVQNLYGVRMKKQEKALRILTREEEQRLRRALAGDLNLRNLGILLCLDTGMRLGELCALKWEDVAGDGRSIFIHRTAARLCDRSEGSDRLSGTESEESAARLRKRGEGSERLSGTEPEEAAARLPAQGAGAKTRLFITSPKGDQSIRTVPVPAEDAALLRQFRAADEVFLLTGEADRFADNRTIQYYLKRVQKGCGLEGISFNDLRDTFAVRCLESGGSILRLSEILGHINVAFTAGHYLPFVSDGEAEGSACALSAAYDPPSENNL